MCRMTGLVAAAAAPEAAGDASGGGGAEKTLPIWQHLVGATNSLRTQAKTGAVLSKDSPGHADSWGVGWFDGQHRASLLRQTGSAADSAHFVFAAEVAARGGAGSGPATVALGHLRKASCGVVSSENAHPVQAFYGTYGQQSILVAHNGTLRLPLLATLRTDLREAERAEGRSDSDTVVLAGWLAQRVGEAESGIAVFDALADALRELFERAQTVAPNGDLSKVYSGVNLLIACDEGLVALRQFSRHPDYYTLSARPLTPVAPDEAPGWIVASEPTDDAPGWEPLVPGMLTLYPTAKSGEVRTVRVA